MADAVARTRPVKRGHPLDPQTMIGAQASNDQLEKILSYVDIGKAEGATVLTGGERAHLGGELAGGYYMTPTIFAGDNSMRIFQEEIFGPVVSVARFSDEADALKIANDTLYGLGAGVWTRDGARAYRAGREIQAGRVWTNCYHVYPGARRLRRVQAVRGRPRDAPDNARALPADQEPPGQLFPEGTRLLLSRDAMTADEPRRVDLTAAAADLLRWLDGRHGPLMFHQSGGCRDGSSPMYFPDGEFQTDEADIMLGVLPVPGLDRPVPFWMSRSQYEYWKHIHLTVDVVPGRGSGFSVEAPDGVRFLIRSRLLTEEELDHFRLTTKTNNP
jgi:uncharacterized protein (DUF779 family)